MNSTPAQPEGPSTSAEAASLEFRGATKRYPGAERAAVEALSLEVPAGEICVLVGPSGCGKTTAMRMVNRMIEISDGDILVGDGVIADVYEKPKSDGGKLEFYVTETTWRRETSDEPVVTTRFTLAINCKPDAADPA